MGKKPKVRFYEAKALKTVEGTVIVQATSPEEANELFLNGEWYEWNDEKLVDWSPMSHFEESIDDK